MKKQYIRDFKEGDTVDDYFAVKEKTPPKKYNNKDGRWFSLELTDKTKTITAKFWGGSNEITVNDLYRSFKTSDIVAVKGIVINYSGKLEIHINEGVGQINKAENGSYDLHEFVPKTDKSIDELITLLRTEIESIKDLNIKRLLKSFFDDPIFMNKYSQAPAAQSFHHSCIGGLIEHVWSMIEMSKVIVKQYTPHLDLDLMLAGCMLHDIGKIEEYETKATIEYTTTGRLLGHISIGARMVETNIENIKDFPLVLKSKIIHLILSHHGLLEFGSPVVPLFPEALALHKIDECDSKVKHAIQVKKELQESNVDEMEIMRIPRDGLMYMK